ncbi:MAG: tRNA guanosine(15) transglycosylase TgtA [Candidatus Bathyarchaeota archaeon]|nr:tRNA guanosine(15) transglycosylase TgtA [Candidatus Bathyarchaeota archaeon]
MFEFEVRDRDILARIGRLKTKSGTVETPVFLPVINMAKQSVSPRDLWTNFGCRMLITNAYIIKKQQGETARKEGVHAVLDFPGAVMTDSGAYQILAYGKVDVTPAEVVRFQEEIGADISTILDLPTGWKVSKKRAKHTVEETIKRAEELERLKTRGDIGWVGPVQGGRYLDLVAMSAQRMAELPFEVHALGSPTPVMEQYLFDLLVDMVLTAKMNLPSNRLFHLFGAGHPFMFALAVALGCDLFDSAAYSIFAQEDRYLTSHGTVRLGNLSYLPCSCPVCAKRDPKDLTEMAKEERERELTRHNLHVCFSEMRRIKQAIAEGRLWEHLEMRAHGHPSLLQALRHLGKYSEYIERHSPIIKRSGLFYFSSVGLARPEVTRHRKRLFERYSPPERAEVLLLLPDLGRKHTTRRRRRRKTLAFACEKLGVEENRVHVCVYAPPFGVVPDELEGVYPLSQYECVYPPDRETVEYVAEQVAGYVEAVRLGRTVMLVEPGTWHEEVAERCSRICVEKGVKLEVLRLDS